MSSRMLSPFVTAVFIVALAKVSSGAIQKNNSDFDNIGTRDINKGTVNFVSLDNEVAMGRQTAAEVERTWPIVTDSTISEYVNRVGQTVVRNSDAKVFQFTIRVIDSDELNAFALPGGFLFVNSGLILSTDDESELASIMAHQIAHVAARDSTEYFSSQQGFSLTPFLTGWTPFSTVQFSEEMEEEADYLGVQYLYKSGYDPNAMVRLLQRLQLKERSERRSTFFPIHPLTGGGSSNVEKAIESILPTTQRYVENKSEFDRIKALLVLGDRRPAADNPEIAPAQGEPPTLKRKRIN